MAGVGSKERGRLKCGAAIAVIALLGFGAAPAGAHSGLDRSFGEGGTLFTGFGERRTASAQSIERLVVENDGKIVLGMTAPGGGFMLARLNPNGTPDTSFGGDGEISTAIAARAMAVQPDGKIVVAGSRGSGNPGMDIAVMRYRADGQIDTSFGGKGIERLRGGNEDSAGGVAIQPSGTIVVTGSSECFGADRRCGYTYSTIVMARFRPDGKLLGVRESGGDEIDSQAMGGRGQIVALVLDTEGGERYDRYLVRFEPGGALDRRIHIGAILGDPRYNPSLALQANDKILLAYGNGVRRLQPDGSPDTAFGANGEAACVSPATPESSAQRRSVQVLADGRLLVAGGSGECGLTRYLPDGAPDPSFGSGGKLDVRPQLGASPQALASGPDGTALVARWDPEEREFRFARYLPDGAPDPSFGSGGVAFLPGESPTLDQANALLSMPGGRLLAVGTARCPERSCGEFALASYRPDGRLNRAFGRGGLMTSAPDGVGVGTSAAIQHDGRIVVAGGSGAMEYGELKRERLALARYTPGGRLDPSFGEGGIETIPSAPGEDVQANAVAIDPNGGIVVAGEAACTDSDECGKRYCSECASFVIARFLSNGKLDPAFGTDGLVRIDVGHNDEDHDAARAIAIQADGRIVVAGRTYLGGFGVVRLLPDGRRDPSFGRHGIVRTVFSVRLRDNRGEYFRIEVNRPATTLALTPRGEVVVGGGIDIRKNHGVVVRYRGNGTIDRRFGHAGLVDVDRLAIKSLALDRCGRLVLAGALSPEPGLDELGVTRRLPSGQLDRSFSKGGLRLALGAGEDSHANAVVARRSDIVIAGVADSGATRDDFALAAFDAGGACAGKR